MDDTTASVLSLSVPGDSSALSIVRLFVGAVGHHLDLTLESIDDLKVVLSELCSEAIEGASSAGSTLMIDVRSFPDAPALRIASSTGAAFHPQADEAGEFRRGLIEALAPDLEASPDQPYYVDVPLPAATQSAARGSS